MLPEQALAAGRWVKLICGASNQDLAAIEDLCGIYTLAGVDCIDLAADGAVVAAARRGMAWALERGAPPPWLMLSLSDGADPHFRKAWFDPERCPPGCPRPCQRVCPALAIGTSAGVFEERCYGCGRCLPVCPWGLIEERDHQLAPPAVAPLLRALQPQAVEIHTRPGRATAFAERLAQVKASGLALERLAVSCGLEPATAEHDPGLGPIRPERLAEELWQRFALLRRNGFKPLWQLDGRPMSGDVGAGTARAAVLLLERILAMAPPGPIQLAGGTNGLTLALCQGLAKRSGRPRGGAAGVAFGGVARRRLQPHLLKAQRRQTRLLDDRELVEVALKDARALVTPWRTEDGGHL
ncbi:LdpA C-terminal domain-containing domain [Cyanobium sp. Morenito 9A2]|uniref:Light dependent period protein LdpA domain-containing protein n=1 Tax=Cyanobium sp. Morenito 9A2 TaxID=2823718 RepID=UPI0020CEA295|nr:LdpA C-terminal domain-containing domain [Cyanobium sp. Morenito 9A2]MCP9850619.1 4Fe-4S binding protein [Cyanobium sp. Morenito 9A2]